MKTYILISTISISVFYLAYRLFLRKEIRLNHLRAFLLFSMLLSLVLPFTKYSIKLNLPKEIEMLETPVEEVIPTTTPANMPTITMQEIVKAKKIDYWRITYLLYVAGMAVILTRLIIHLLYLYRLIVSNEKIKEKGFTFIVSHKITAPSSFFKWIFIPTDLYSEIDKNKIIAHEKIHATQYHSIDLILIELLSAVMWFNPLVWMMRKSVQLVHEYLADEGALGTGIDRLKYQALLVNQITEGRLICLSSSFNHSLIKKRMIMMTKNKFKQKSTFRILILIPLAGLLFFGVACVNGQDKPEVIASVAPTKMNVMFVGVDNPVSIAVSGYKASEIDVSVPFNGNLKGELGNYIVNPKRPGNLFVVVCYKGDTLQKTEFRVKSVPNPLATVAGKTNGAISKSELLKQNIIKAEMQNFDFDVRFTVTEFTVSATIEGFAKEAKSNTSKFTAEQKKIISDAKPGQRVYFQDIICVGPEGKERELQTMAFVLKL